MIYFLQYCALLPLIGLARLLPVGVSSWIARRFGDLVFWLLPGRRRIALENVDKAFGDSLATPEKGRIARAAFQNAALSMTELFIVEKIKKEAARRFTLTGNEHLEEAFAKQKGVVLVISHLGSWEYLSFLPFLTGRRWSVIVKEIKNPYLDNAVNALRRVMTVNPVEKLSSIRLVLQQLKEGNGVAILIDQWAGDEGLWIDFFGTETSTTSIPVRLAEKTGCALVPGCCLRAAAGRYEIRLGKAIAPDLNRSDWENVTTQQLNEVLEKEIQKYPEQWLWGHRRWKGKPDIVRNA